MTSVPSQKAFQFTRPRRARLAAIEASLLELKFQFTRPRGARHYACWPLSCGSLFQFTRPRGARPGRTGRKPEALPFQFTRPRGARQKLGVIGRVVCDVSIHAPTRGATSAEVSETATAISVSIHAPTRGATFLPGHAAKNLLFQFTRPRGARPWL